VDAITVSLDTLDEPGKRQVTGIAVAIPSGPDGGVPLERDGNITWKRLDLAALRTRLPYPVLGISILEAPDSGQRGFPRRLEPQPLDDGPHLSYAIQWFAFGVIALVGGSILVARERDRPRR
jgi:surfeit locus 1 family protein